MLVEIYGGTWCNPCMKVKKWSEDNGHEVKFYDIGENPVYKGEAALRLGSPITSIPHIWVDGHYVGQSSDFFAKY